MKNIVSRSRIMNRILCGLCLTLPFLFTGCQSSPFGSVLAMDDGYYSEFTDSLDTAHGFDRLVCLRLIIDDPDHILRGLSKMLDISPRDQTHPHSFAGCDISYGGWQDGRFDAILAFQARTASVVLRTVSGFNFNLGSYGRLESRESVEIPMNLPFILTPGAVNYLGRVHLSIARGGASTQSFGPGPDVGSFAKTSTTRIRSSIRLSRDDAGFREDMDLFRSLNPEMRIPENVVKSGIK